MSSTTTALDERVLYARTKVTPGGKPAVVGGVPITEEQAIELRVTAFGSASCPPRGEWLRTPLVMRSPEQPLAYGLAAPRNGARSLLSALQAHIVKWLLFDSRPLSKDNKSVGPPDVGPKVPITLAALPLCIPKEIVWTKKDPERGSPPLPVSLCSILWTKDLASEHHGPAVSTATGTKSYLRPSEERQEEALWRACSEVIWRCAGGYNPQPDVDPKAIIALPSDMTYVQHSSHYYQDGITEKLHLYEFKNLEDIQIFMKRYLHLFQEEESAGSLLLMYAAMLSRGCENVKKDLDGKLTYLVSAHVEGSINVATLLLTGRATPYLHNGVLYVGDEDHYAMPQFGVLSRSPVGLLVWYGGDDSGKNNVNKQYPGSRLKTPAFPIWVTSCSGHYGLLFNTNRELLRNYHAERRFDINYYTCGGCHVLLNVDTRAHDEVSSMRTDDISATPLEKLIHTKWQDAKITWNGTTPYVGEIPN